MKSSLIFFYNYINWILMREKLTSLAFKLGFFDILGEPFLIFFQTLCYFFEQIVPSSLMQLYQLCVRHSLQKITSFRGVFPKKHVITGHSVVLVSALSCLECLKTQYSMEIFDFQSLLCLCLKQSFLFAYFIYTLYRRDTIFLKRLFIPFRCDFKSVFL